MLRTIHLHGPLKKLCPEGLKLDSSNALEAVNGMSKVLGLKPNPITGRISVKVLGFDTVEELTAQTDVVDIHIVPAFFGGKSGFVQIVIGAVLVAASLLLPPLGMVAGVAVSGLLFGMGASMVLGGVMQALFPVKVADREPNSYLGAPGNTTRIGTRIPLVLGEVKAFGQILSYNVDALAT